MSPCNSFTLIADLLTISKVLDGARCTMMYLSIPFKTFQTLFKHKGRILEVLLMITRDISRLMIFYSNILFRPCGSKGTSTDVYCIVHHSSFSTNFDHKASKGTSTYGYSNVPFRP